MLELLKLLPACLPAQVTRYERLRARMQSCAEQARAPHRYSLPFLLTVAPTITPVTTTATAATTAQALSRREQKTLQMVNSLVDIELAHLNTSHPDFIGGSEAMRHIATQLQVHVYAHVYVP